MRIRKIFAGCVLCGMIALLCSPLPADDPVAPLNESDSFDSDTGSYTLKVDTDGKTIKADSFQIIQGDPDTQYTIDTSAGKGGAKGQDNPPPKRVATVEKKTGAVLYRVSGTFVGSGGAGSGTEPARWHADYDYGGKRMILWVNTESPSDDFVGLGGDGTATIMLPFSDDDKKYTIRLSDGDGAGVVKFRMKGTQNWLTTLDIELGEIPGEGWRPSLEVEIHGDTAGNDKIHAANTAVSAGGTLLNQPDGVDTDCPVVALSVKAVKIKLANPDPPAEGGALPVFSDDKGEDVGASAEWTNEGRREAAAFEMGEDKKIKFKVTFTGPAGTTVKVKAADGGTAYVNETDIVFPAGQGNTEKEEEVEIQQPIGNAVDLKQWTLKWQYKSGETWIDTTQTQHRVYVTLDEPSIPIMPGGASKTLDSYYFIACGAGAGATSADDLKTKLWNCFSKSATHTGPPIKRSDCSILGFWRDARPTRTVATLPNALVKTTDGDCHAWALLYRCAAGIHAQTISIKLVLPDPAKLPNQLPGQAPYGWAFILTPFTWNDISVPPDGKGRAPQIHPLSWTYNSTIVNPPAAYRKWPPANVDCTDDGGRKAQGNSNAHAEWGDHALFLQTIGGNERWYDPSYGKVANTLADYEAAALGTGVNKAGGYVLWYSLPLGGQIVRLTVAMQDQANAQLQAQNE